MWKTRPDDEDALLAGAGRDDGPFAVADGTGGCKAGEVASLLAVATSGKLCPPTIPSRGRSPGRAGDRTSGRIENRCYKIA